MVSLQEVYELKRNEHLNELQRKEDEMRQMFVLRVKDKEGELKKSEKEVRLYENNYLVPAQSWTSLFRAFSSHHQPSGFFYLEAITFQSLKIIFEASKLEDSGGFQQ